MPFDGEIEHNEGHERLRHLSTVLRDRTQWPGGFEWNYASCQTCAIGMAFKLGMLSADAQSRYSVELDRTFDLTPGQALHIFFDLADANGYRLRVSPEMVADAIDHALSYLDRQVSFDLIP